MTSMTRTTIQRVSFFALACAALTLLPAAEGSAAMARRSGCRRVLVHSPEHGNKKSRRRPKFSASEILDLELQVLVSRRKLDGDHRLELKVYTPSGNLYQSLSVPFTIGEEISTGTRRGRYQMLTTTLPVAGTSIVTSSLYGTWKVEAFLDGATGRCTAPRKFVIKP